MTTGDVYDIRGRRRRADGMGEEQVSGTRLELGPRTHAYSKSLQSPVDIAATGT